jgi:hypothetical protein
MVGNLRGMVSELETGRGSVLHAHLKHAVGYRVDGPEGHLGRVQRVPHAGRPPQPLILVVSDDKTVRFVSLRRVAAVLPPERRIVLRKRQTAAVSVGSANATWSSMTMAAPKWGR